MILREPGGEGGRCAPDRGRETEDRNPETLYNSERYDKEGYQLLKIPMATKRQQRITQKLKKDTLAVLKEKLAEMILLREEIEAQENFAIDYAEKKAIVQQIIDVVHKIQALKTVIRLFAEEE